MVALPGFGVIENSDCHQPGSPGRPHSSEALKVLGASNTKERERS